MKNHTHTLMLIMMCGLLPLTLKAQCIKDSSIYYTFVNGSAVKTPTAKVLYYYNSKDSLIGLTIKGWDDTKVKWKDSYKRDIQFDQNGRVLKLIVSTMINDTWKFNHSIDYTYDSIGRQVSGINRYYKKDSLTIGAGERSFTVYNSDNKVVLSQLWNNTLLKWVSKEKDSLYYNDAKLTVHLSYIWNTDNGKWIPENKVNYTYNGNVLQKRHEQSWDCGNGPCGWDAGTYEVYHRDSKGLDTATYSYKGLDNSIYAKMLKDFNENTCSTHVRYFNMDQSSLMQLTNQYDHFYRNRNTSVSAQTSHIMQVYPNPANHSLYISNTGNQPFEFRSLLSGSTVLCGQLGDNQNTIDVSALSNGLYVLKTGNSAQIIIVQH